MMERIQDIVSHVEGVGAEERVFSIQQMQQAIDEGYEGFIVEDQVQGFVYKAQKPEQIILPVSKEPLVAATGSKLRQKFLTYMAEASNSNTTLSFLPLDNEEVLADTPDIVARQKAIDTNNDFSLGIDILMMLPGKGYAKKPRSLNEIGLNMQELYTYAQNTRLNQAYYYINAAAVLRTSEQEYTGKSAMIVGLSLNTIQHLTTQKGIKKYLDVADHFQDKQATPEYAASLYQVGGGLALPIFLHLGAVESINGVPFDNAQPETYHAFLSAYRTAVVGGGDSVYQGLFGEEAKFHADNWHWLHAKASSLINL